MACATGEDKCNQENCGVCYPLIYAIENDVVYYIYHYSDRATLDYIVIGCELTFSDPDIIVEAKKELLVFFIDFGGIRHLNPPPRKNKFP